MDQMLQHLALHAQTAHPIQQNQGNGAARGKVDRPTVHAAIDQEGWSFFMYDWENYKAAMNIKGTAVSAHLYGCLDEELKRDLQRANQGESAASMTEENLLLAIKKLAVKDESKLAHRIKMGRAVQSPGTGIRTFHAQLKGLATPCEYKITSTCTCGRANTIAYEDSVIQDQLVRGIADQDILADLLGDEKSDRTTSEIVDFIARKEQAKSERETVANDTAAAVSTPKPKPTRLCRGCGGQDHGGKSQRLQECPAREVVCDKCQVKGHYSKHCIRCKDCQTWGHGSKYSRHCNVSAKVESANAGITSNSRGFVVSSSLSNITSKADVRLATVGTSRGRALPLTHRIFTTKDGWISAPSAPHPTLPMLAAACPEDHEQFGHRVSDPIGMSTSNLVVVCDTGCQSTAIPAKVAYSLGFKRKDFIRVVMRMDGAGKNDLGVIGAVVIKFKRTQPDGKMKETKQLCYICSRVDKAYMSRQGLEELGIIGQNFPVSLNAISGQATPADCDCGCPLRPPTPPSPITTFPADLTEDPAEMKKYLLSYYKSTVFSTCECQPLPLLPGPPLRLNVDSNATPVACHRMQPIPLHWQDKVLSDLKRDVNLGVLEKLPTNTPTEWLSRMVVTAKSNGDPRRTVDYQKLNKYVKRQTFPLETPFQLATKIPPGAKKSVLDNWNGYHSVSLHEDDRHYTAFLAPNGRYCYKVAAQGSMVSGDAFNERMDEIFTDFQNKVRCVDDAAIWTNEGGNKSHFLKVAEYLNLCAQNNIVLNPDKFQFCLDTVNFAGFRVSPTSLMPSEKTLEAIRNFPRPTDITGARAFFGLVNQVAFSFTLTEEMTHFRHLLSPKTKFEWTPELDRLFERSKEVIVEKITQGVKLFDPRLPTFLATDFSGKGVGFLLMQKTCSCDSKDPTCCPEGWRTCMVGSRFLHDAESRYAPIEGECLGVVYGLHKCKHFVLGCRDLTVLTDHKPLLGVLNDRCLADIENRRLRNLKEKTLSYQFKIAHVSGKKHVGPDAASRYPVGQADKCHLPDEPPEADFSISSISSTAWDRLASIECVDTDVDSPTITSTKNLLYILAVTHTDSCCLDAVSTCPSPNFISWEDIKTETVEDKEMQALMCVIKSGFPEDSRSLPSLVKPYAPYQSSLYILDSVVMLGDRVVVPHALRPRVLHLLHAAHQGVDRMKARAADVVYWHGIVGDISRQRESCVACHKMAKSNPSLPPYDPPEPEFPFQYLAADYFSYEGTEYCVIVDRYSHWPTVFSSHQGARGFVDCLRNMSSTFGICQEIATDGAKIFTGSVTQTFLKDWGIKHRLSSVANPHSNCRAEIAVKQLKRIITENCSSSGSLNKDSFHRAMLSYRNTPDPHTRVSPAMAVFGRQVKDGLPIPQGHYNPHNTWREVLDHREKALAKRHVAGHEQWEAHTKDLPPLSKGDKVYLQNLVGNHPRRWERTGVIIECKEFDQYLVKKDGTGRSTLRNRKHLRKYTPVPKAPRPEPVPDMMSLPATPHTYTLPPTPEYTPPPTEITPAVHQPHPQEVVHFGHQLDNARDRQSAEGGLSSTPQPNTPPPISAPAQSPATPAPESLPVQRPKRVRIPNVRLDPDEWELGQIEDSTQAGTIVDLLLELVRRMPVDQRGEARGGRR